jgi:hypothetical protein
MANRSKQAEVAETAGSAAQAPAGFQRSGSANAVGWWVQSKAGNVLSGKLVGMFSRKDVLRQDQGGSSKFFQVEIDQPTTVRVERGTEAHEEEVQPGNASNPVVVNVNFGPKTKPWEDFVADLKRGAEYAVWAFAVGRKVKISAGRTMHDIDVRHRMVTPPADVPEFADADGDAGPEAV